MSYDLNAFPVPAGMSAVEFWESQAYEALGDAPPTPEEREAMERAAEVLHRVDPSAERVEDSDFIELVTHDAIQVSVYARSVEINVPYWYTGGEADAVMERVFAYARVISETLGYAVYDPQTDSVVEPGAADHSDATAIMGDMSGRLDEMIEAKRPWWKIWG